MDKISRRDFLKRSAAGAVVAGAASVGCAPKGSVVSRAESEGELPQGQMTFRKDPKTGKDVSILAYGCMRWPMTMDDDNNEIIDQEQVNALIDCAMRHGVNYYDTAPVYLQGNSERATALALSRYPRESYFLATKLSNFNASTHNLAFAKKMLSNSLKNLMTDYIDYYLFHSLHGGRESFENRFVKNGILDYCLEKRKKGVIRHLGFSFHDNRPNLQEILDYHEEYKAKTGENLFDFVMIQMNWSDWHYAKGKDANAADLYALLEEHDLPVMVMEPLLGGRLSNVPDHIAKMFKELEPQKSVASWAFRFAASHRNVQTVLSGMTYMEHLQDNLKTYSPLVELNDSEKEFLDRMAGLMHQYPIVNCTGCEYCMPCPYGLDIPAIFAHYNKCVNEGYVSSDSQDEEYRRNRRAFLVSYDRAIPKLRQADRCIQCRKCMTESHCPQRINIPGEL
ncbi:MAG: aldo/keto reductase, partial [Candidatus Cryptobacteroides sp.]